MTLNYMAVSLASRHWRRRESLRSQFSASISHSDFRIRLLLVDVGRGVPRSRRLEERLLEELDADVKKGNCQDKTLRS